MMDGGREMGGGGDKGMDGDGDEHGSSIYVGVAKPRIHISFIE